MPIIIKIYKVRGHFDLQDMNLLLESEDEFLDISEAKMGIDEEHYKVCMDWCQSGPVYRVPGYRRVEVLNRLLEQSNV